MYSMCSIYNRLLMLVRVIRGDKEAADPVAQSIDSPLPQLEHLAGVMTIFETGPGCCIVAMRVNSVVSHVCSRV